jgi:hypothetical protein
MGGQPTAFAVTPRLYNLRNFPHGFTTIDGETRVPEPESKRCSKCGEIKPLSEFNRKARGRLQPYCRACNSRYLKEHYANNLSYYVEKAARFKKSTKRANLAKLLEYFADHPCVDCGETDPVVLQFDHVRGTKFKAVGTLFNECRQWDVIAAEIEKCEVRCSNCHWRKTAKELGWYAYADPGSRG